MRAINRERPLRRSGRQWYRRDQQVVALEGAVVHVGVREFRTHLSRYLRRVETGETFALTYRGKVFAYLTPPGVPDFVFWSSDPEEVQARLTRLRHDALGGAGLPAADPRLTDPSGVSPDA